MELYCGVVVVVVCVVGRSGRQSVECRKGGLSVMWMSRLDVCGRARQAGWLAGCLDG